MINTLRQSFQIGAAVTGNTLIYWCQRLPLVGKLFKDRLYAEGSLKDGVCAVAFLLKACTQVLYKALYVCLAIWLPAAVVMETLTPQQRVDAFLWFLLMMSFVGGALIKTAIGDTSAVKYTCVKLMGMPAQEYLPVNGLFSHLMDILYLLPATALFSALIGFGVLRGLLLAPLWVAAHLIGERVQLWLFDRFGLLTQKKMAYQWVLVILIPLAAYLPPFLQAIPPVGRVVASPLFWAALLGLGALAAHSLFRYRNYPAFARQALPLSEVQLDAKKASNQAQFASVKLRDKDFAGDALQTGKYDRKTGYDYLNAIFFDRHKRLFFLPVCRRLAVVAVAAVLSFGCLLFFPEIARNLGGYLPQSLPLMVFLMYLLSIGDQACRAMFYNCDISLLRYGFYRQKEVILRNFHIRLRRLCGFNLITAGGICLYVLSFGLAAGLNWPPLDILSYCATVLMLAVFFSVHHLFLYYVFQPYTAELDIKNPFYTLLNMVVYIACFVCLKLDSQPAGFAFIVLGATVLYTAVALVLIYRWAPKNFRVK